jgi:hypothetical protein
MTAIPPPQRSQRITETASQSRDIGDVSQQTRTSVTDHASSITADNDLRTRSGNLHLASAFRDG